MPQRRAAYPSALKTGAAHFALSTGLFTGLAVSVAGMLNVLGDAEDAGPVIEVALFEPVEAAGPPSLKARLADRSIPDLQIAAMVPVAERPELEEPSLGVEYRPFEAPPARQLAEARPSAPAVEEGSSAEPMGVRINGRTVLPGEAFSAVRETGETPSEPSPALKLASLKAEAGAAAPAATSADAGPAPAEAYARAFDNPDGRPTVSIVLGGLGLNYTHTRTAIAELPPEVTLSFSPHTKGLSTWISRARDAGHEVLIEVPMEAEEYGRISPHPLTLTAGASEAETLSRLDRLLPAGSDYFGVINYQGDRFATDPALAGAVMEHLDAKGLAFIEDGNLAETGFAVAADQSGARYAGADEVIDVRIEADAMRDRLMALESIAANRGSALGTAIAYPVTIDALRDWAQGLDARGLVLAPASHAVRAGRTAKAGGEQTESATVRAPSLFAPDGRDVAWTVVPARPLAASGGE